jgi:peptidoglycan hydrolase FlgJ
MTTPLTAAAAPAPGSATPAAGAAAPSGTSSIRQAAEGFEGVFMSILVEEMLKGTEVAKGNPMYSGLVTEKLGDQLARSGGIGLADLLERQMGGGS